jgi:hypothetical protein
MMKRFLSFLALALLGPFWRMPAWAQLTTLGVGGIAAAIIGPLTPPAITPQPSAAFTPSNGYGGVNVGLKPNGGTIGAFELPSTATNSFALYHEFAVDPSFAGEKWLFGNGGATTVNGVIATSTNFGSPSIAVQRSAQGSGSQNFFWWLPTVGATTFGAVNPLNITPGSNYNPGFYTWTASDGCPTANGAGAREPAGVILSKTSLVAAAAYTVDTGFLCGENASGLSPRVNFAAVPAVGASQSTGASSTPAAAATTCASNTPTSTQFTVTAHVGVAHGLNSGQSFTLTGFSPSGLNQTYAAIAGTAGTTLIGTIANVTGTCPTGSITEGNVGSGAGGAIIITAPSHTNPYGLQAGTGIQIKPGQRVCGVIGEFGADSSFPGAAYAYYTDHLGNALPGSPAVSPWLNQGATNFAGYTITGAQLAGTPALTVTAMNAYSISSATYNAATGFVTFTMSQNPGFIIGSEFTVSGTSVAGFNNVTYVAVAGTSGLTLVGNPLSGPVGIPQANNPGAPSATGGSMVGVIMPGMYVTGATGYSVISPFGTFGSTGVGGIGTYGLTATQAVFNISATAPSGSNQLTVTGTPTSQIVVGTSLVGANIPSGTVVQSIGIAVGGAGVYTMSANTTGAVSGTITGGPIGSSGTPVPMYAAEGFYYKIAPSGSAAGGGTVTAQTSATLGDFVNLIGTSSGAASSLTGNNALGWGGTIGNVGMFEGAPFPNANGAPSSAGMAQLCTKTKEFQSWASTYGGAWRSLYRFNDGGIWADSGVAQFTGSITGAALTVNSTQTGSTTALPNSTVIAGAGVSGCPNNCPTISGQTDSTHYTLSASGATLASVALTAGAYEPATPLGTTQFNGQISGNVLKVNSMATAWTGTAHLSGPAGAACGNGAACNTLTVDTTTSGALAQGQCVSDGGVAISPQYPLCITGGASPAWTVSNSANYYPGIASEAMTSTLSAIIPGQFISDGGTSITTPVQVIAYGGGTGPAGNGLAGTYTLSSSANGTVAAETMTSTGISSGGAIAPGAALTVDNPGAGAIYPITNFSTDLGTMKFAGAYSHILLNGDPTFIQAQVSSTPAGAPVRGCAACAWTNLSSAAVNTGAQTWSGSIANIPAGGPYWVSFRAANGQSYATLTNAVFVGVNVAAFGEGNGAAQLSGGPGLPNQTFFPGFLSITGFQAGGASSTQASNGVFIPGPPIIGSFSFSQPTQLLVDRFGVFSSASSGAWDGTAWLAQNASSMLGGSPVGIASMFKNGTNFSNVTYNNLTQTQSIGTGDGSTATFSSGLAYGGSVGTATASTNGIGGISGNTLTITNLNSLAPIWQYVAPGEQVSCGSCTAGTVITAMAGPWAPTLTGGGSTGTYLVSPSQTVSAGTALTITHNNLQMNGAFGNGAIVNGQISGAVLTVNSVQTGSLAPSGLTAMIVSDGGVNIPANVSVTGCLTGCGANAGVFSSSTWSLSQSFGSPVSAETMLMAPSTGVSYPAASVQPQIIPVQSHGGGTGGGAPVIKVGSFQVLVNGVSVCQDSNTFAYNEQLGNCAGMGVRSAWVNYVTGAYSVTFATAPAANASIVAQWANLMSGNNTGGADEQIDWVGDGTKTGGVLSSIAANTGGINAISMGQQCPLPPWPDNTMTWAKQINWIFASHMSVLHNTSTNLPVLLPGMWRSQGPIDFYGGEGNLGTFECEQWMQDAATRSEFNGTISGASGASALLTLSGAATGPMWEGEALECNPYAAFCALPIGTEITGLASGTWGASGSTYNLTSPGPSFTNVGPLAIHNTMFYPAGNAAYVGPYVDLSMQDGSVACCGAAVETGGGITGALRYGHRFGLEMGAALSGHPEKATSATLSRTSFTGCDASAGGISPCFQDDNTYSTTATATAISGATLTFNGLTAGQIPIVDGTSVSCSGCTTGLVVLSVSNPPTQSTAPGAGQIGSANNGFTVKLSAAPGVTGSGHAFTFGCSGSAGVGSNCILFNFNINTTGTYGTPAAINTCGVNNLVGTNTNPPANTAYIYPNGQCVPTGIGALVRTFRIGTAAVTDDISSNLGSPYDFGGDIGNSTGNISQNGAFTCNIVDSTVVRCVDGPDYVNGAFSAIGQWASGSTFTTYGDPYASTGFISGLIGYPGGQSFPFTPGSGYTNGHYATGGVCALGTGGGALPEASAMGYTIAGGAIINAYPTLIGNGSTTQCSYPLSFTFTGVITSWNSGTLHANLAATGIMTQGTIVAGEVITGAGIPSGSTIVSGPGNGLNGTYVISCPTTCNVASETLTSGSTGGTGGSITTPPIGPLEGVGGIATYDTDNNLMGTMLYDNSGVAGNPNAGAFALPASGLESPGLPVRPWGMRRGAAVSG